MSITRNTQIFAEKAGKYTISATVQNFWYIYTVPEIVHVNREISK